MQTVYAYKRLTHNYAPGWRHLDKDVFVGAVKLTPPRLTELPNGYDDGGAYVQYGRAPADADMQDLIRGLQDSMGGTSCRHDYDCCGCALYYVSIKHMGSRRLQIRTRVGYNY
jgi:hypothetical protein